MFSSIELWAQIPNFTDYRVSTLGRVQSKRPRGMHAKGFGKPDRTVWRILSIGLSDQVILCNANGKFAHIVPRLVAEAFIPNPNNYPNVLHNNDDRSNNTIGNLRWGTQKMNLADAKRNRPNWIDKYKKIESAKRARGHYNVKRSHSSEVRARISASNITTKARKRQSANVAVSGAKGV